MHTPSFCYVKIRFETGNSATVWQSPLGVYLLWVFLRGNVKLCCLGIMFVQLHASRMLENALVILHFAFQLTFHDVYRSRLDNYSSFLNTEHPLYYMQSFARWQ